VLVLRAVHFATQEGLDLNSAGRQAPPGKLDSGVVAAEAVAEEVSGLVRRGFVRRDNRRMIAVVE
jgi:hypothetical protein